jgi:hypothetical protein
VFSTLKSIYTLVILGRRRENYAALPISTVSNCADESEMCGRVDESEGSMKCIPVALLAVFVCGAAAFGAVPVSVTEDAAAYTLANGIVTARVDKGSGDLVSLKYNGLEMLATIMGTDGMPDMRADPAG